jgi:hypothetical protein
LCGKFCPKTVPGAWISQTEQSKTGYRTIEMPLRINQSLHILVLAKGFALRQIQMNTDTKSAKAFSRLNR